MRFDLKPSHLLLAVAAAFAAQAAPAQSLTRAQVIQQLEEARRSGDVAFGEAGLTLREQFPGKYPERAQPQGRTRAEVQAEVQAAIANGDDFRGGEAGNLDVEFKRGYTPGMAANSVLTREQVRAELFEAIRSGNIVASGESGLTLRELYPGRYESRRTEMAKSGHSTQMR